MPPPPLQPSPFTALAAVTLRFSDDRQVAAQAHQLIFKRWLQCREQVSHVTSPLPLPQGAGEGASVASP